MTTPATEWPSTPIPESIKELLSRFFVVGDALTAEAARELGEKLFTPYGQIVVNKKVIAGTTELSRHHGAPGLRARKHVVHKVYSCSEAGDDLMLLGNVTWTFRDGSSENSGFATRAIIEDGGSEKPKLKLYQGWADLSDFMAGMARQG